MSSGVPDDVAELIAGYIDSVEKLEIILLLRGERDRTWTSEEVSRELRRNPASCARGLAQLGMTPLISGSPPDGYRFEPDDEKVERLVDRLADTYATRRPSVIQLIASNPMDSVTTFADAFRFRRKR